MDFDYTFWEKSLDPGYYDKILENGLSKNKGIQSFWHNTTFNLIKNYIKKSEKHLDYACGPGSFTGRYIAINSLGFDISLNQINYAKTKFSDKKNCNFVNEKSKIIQEAPFDTITVLGLIEFLEDAEVVNLIDELYSLLNHNGKLILTTPNYQLPMKILISLTSNAGKIDYNKTFINKFNIKKIEKTLHETDTKNYKIFKYMNIGIVFSLFSHQFGIQIQELVDKIFKKKFGFMLAVIIDKK